MDVIRVFVENQIASRRFPGASWWIEGTGGVIARGASGPYSERTPFDLASLTKPLATAFLAVLLEADGILDLEAPLESLLDLPADSPYRKTTPVDLALHRSGLPAWRPLYLECETRDDYESRITILPPDVDPGTTLYSDLGYILLGFVVERAGGADLATLFDSRIGVGSLGYARPPDRFRDAAPTEEGNRYEREMAGEAGTGHAWRDRIPPGEVHDANAQGLGGVAGHAGLFGAAEDVAALAREILRLSGTTRDRMLVPAAGSGRTFGFVTASASDAARGILPGDAPGHVGFTGTSLWLDAGRDRVYVLLTNRVHPRVDPADFQPVRAEFHRLAAALPDPG